MRVQREELHLLTGAYAVDGLHRCRAGPNSRGTCTAASQCADGGPRAAGDHRPAGMAAAVDAPARDAPAGAGRRHSPAAAPPVGPHAAWPRRAPQSRRGCAAWSPRPVTSVAVAALVAAVVVLIVLQIRTRQQLQEAQAGNRVAAAILAAPDARLETGATSLEGTMTAVISPHDSEAVITTVGMPVPSGTKVYQLWVISTAGVRFRRAAATKQHRRHLSRPRG